MQGAGSRERGGGAREKGEGRWMGSGEVFWGCGIGEEMMRGLKG